ncbi:MAG: hypothetical protein J6S85_20055 [Methanobrevibacter sp.]|nr:hypothetical protein [Methanobrevibacter sp.]
MLTNEELVKMAENEIPTITDPHMRESYKSGFIVGYLRGNEAHIPNIRKANELLISLLKYIPADQTELQNKVEHFIKEESYV